MSNPSYYFNPSYYSGLESIAANPVQHKKSFSIEYIWEIVEKNILKLTFILK